MRIADVDELSRDLQSFLNFAPTGGPADDSLRLLVERFRNVRIEMFPREHPPPHFHVSCSEFEATFSILDVNLLDGNLPRSEMRRVQEWYGFARPKLAEIWNRTRPSDCPVGPVE